MPRGRYGGYDDHAQNAWKILMQTAYGQRADGVLDHGERDAAPESFSMPTRADREDRIHLVAGCSSLRSAQLNQAFAELLSQRIPANK